MGCYVLISIIIPCYNEEKTIAAILNKVISVKLPEGIEKEVIVVDDKSLDKSYFIAWNFSPRIKTFRHRKNCGKGVAIATGIKKSKGEFIIVQDADLEYNPEEYRLLIDCMLKNKADVVYGSRFINKKFSGRYYWGNKLITFVANVLYWNYGNMLSDVETCYKLFRKEIFYRLDIKAYGFEFEPEFTAKCLKRGFKIYEVPISYNPRGFKEGKKIRIKDGVKAMLALIKYRFVD